MSIYAFVGGVSNYSPCPDPFEDSDAKLCAVCGEYKRDVEDYRVCEATIPMCEACLLAGQEAVAEIEDEINRAFPHWIEGVA